MSDKDFLTMCKDMNPSGNLPEGVHDENLTKIKNRLSQKENEIMKKNRRISKAGLIAAVAVLTLGTSAVVFGGDIVNHFRSISLGDHATFVQTEGDYLRMIINEEGQMITDLPEDVIFFESEYGQVQEIRIIEEDGLSIVQGTVTSALPFVTMGAQEALDKFATDAAIPTHLPEGFELENAGFFVSDLQELEKVGANYYMFYTFSNGIDAFSVQVRYMTGETGIFASVSLNAEHITINGHEAVIDDGMVSILIDDVMYMFFGMGVVDTDELVKMAYSLQ